MPEPFYCPAGRYDNRRICQGHPEAELPGAARHPRARGEDRPAGEESTRISEVTGLMIKHFNPTTRTIRIEQRNWRMDIDEPKTEGSKRILALGDLCDRYLDWVAKLDRRGPNDWIFPQVTDSAKPLWDSGVRKALHEASKEVGSDFPGLGPHSFRRANITWRQEVGGSAIEASKIAGHSEVDMTGE